MEINKGGRPKRDNNTPYDSLICKICGEPYLRKNYARHRRSKVHLKMQEFTDKLRILIFSEPEEKQEEYTIEQLRRYEALKTIRQKLKEL